MLVRLQKFLAEAGVASRRASEEIIQAGRVKVNGTIVRELGTRVNPAEDQVVVDGAVLKAHRKQYIALNKPSGYVCSKKDPESRQTVGELLPREWAHLYTVGRLDFKTEGLIFLTNDGNFALHLTHPRYGIRKKYHAVIEGRVEVEALHKMTKGIFHQGERLRAESAHILRGSNSHTLVELELSEGKNREARRLFEAQNLQVLSLKRVQIGPIKLGELRPGRWRALRPVEVQALLSPVKAG